MYRFAAILTIVIVFAVTIGLAQHPPASGPYKVLKTVRAGGEGNWDYIYGDVAGRRLYIPRRGPAGVPATGTRPAGPAIPAGRAVFNLHTPGRVGGVDGGGGDGAPGHPKTGHGSP